MRGGPAIARRTQRISAVYGRREQARLTRALCALDGLDPIAFDFELRRWEDRFRREGALTMTDKMSIIAAEIGVTVDELRAEAEAIMAQTSTLWSAHRRR